MNDFAKNEKQLPNGLRTALYILIAINVLLAAWRAHQVSQGAENVYSLGVPIGFVCLFAGTLLGKQSGALYYVLLGAAMVLMLVSLAGFFVR